MQCNALPLLLALPQPWYNKKNLQNTSPINTKKTDEQTDL